MADLFDTRRAVQRDRMAFRLEVAADVSGDVALLAERRRLRVEDLRGEALVIHAAGRSVMHGTVQALCRDAGFEPRVRHQVAETSTLVTFVAAGLGIAVVPEPVSRLGVAGTTYLPLADRDARIDLGTAVRADDDSPALARVLTVLAQLARGS